MSKFNKICFEGSGKGRIELVGSKYTFAYESQINLRKNLFELGLDFPIIGETKVDLSLNPKEVSKQISHSQLVEVLQEQVGERTDRDQIIKTIEEFFVFASDFIHYKAMGVYPPNFSTNFENEHFTLGRVTPHYNFQVDNFSENEKYFERTVLKIFLKSTSTTNPIMTLFLVPQACEK
ncbi:MAG: hypothetical protein Q7U04_09255 [Bacteriovorax sp.]|nr:hypothetical protein [Bacteriovorax sp.]